MSGSNVWYKRDDYWYLASRVRICAVPKWSVSLPGLELSGGQVSLCKDISLLMSAMVFSVAVSCSDVQCKHGDHCILDQNAVPHCVPCISHCQENARGGEICGADGITYPSMCHFRYATCLHGRSIGVAYAGTCRGKWNARPEVVGLPYYILRFHFLPFWSYFQVEIIFLTVLTCLSVFATLLKKLITGFDENFSVARQSCQEQLIKL